MRIKISGIIQRAVVLIMGLALLPACNVEKPAEQSQPNILFFLIDDQRFETLGCYGHPIVKTPNIDRLAEEGVRFTSAYVTTSICMASRATIFTGMTARSNGVSFGMTPLDSLRGAEVYPVAMRDHGYRTGFIGKFGFNITGNGQPGNWFDFFKPLGRNPYFKEMEDGSLRHETELCGDYAIDFLRSQDKEKPFCLSVSFNASHAEDGDKRPGIGHFPWPKAVDGMYEDIDVPEPRLSDTAIYNAMPQFLKESLNRVRFFWRWDTPEKYQTNIRAYFRMISGIDNTMGRVLAVLEELGMSDNTIIVYTADNGYYMGDRGFAGKWSHFEESLHVPMIIYDPRVPEKDRGRVAGEMVMNMDLTPTFLDLAGLDIPESYQGESLVPFISGEVPGNWRTDFFCEHLAPHPQLPKWEGVHTGKYVYARYFEQDPPCEFLHDLEKDPDQLVNSANDPQMKDVLTEMRNKCNQYIDIYEK